MTDQEAIMTTQEKMDMEEISDQAKLLRDAMEVVRELIEAKEQVCLLGVMSFIPVCLKATTLLSRLETATHLGGKIKEPKPRTASFYQAQGKYIAEYLWTVGALSESLSPDRVNAIEEAIAFFLQMYAESAARAARYSGG